MAIKSDKWITKMCQENGMIIPFVPSQIKSNNDTLANVVGGMLASKIITHDIVQKKYDINRHDYFQDFYK